LGSSVRLSFLKTYVLKELSAALRAGEGTWPAEADAVAAATAELLPISPHNRGRRFEPDTDAATLIDIGALCGDAPDDILRAQYRSNRSPP
jgi:hypothetical protein